MYRAASGGRIVVNPSPTSSSRQLAQQWNASKRVITRLVDGGFLTEDDRGFHVTDAGRAEMATAHQPVTVRQVA